MRRVCLAIPFAFVLAALVAASPSPQDPPPVVPGAPTVVVEVPSPMPAAWQEVKATAGKLIRIKTKDGKTAKWVLVDDGNADLDVAADGKSAAFVARAKGTYKALAWGADGDPGRIRFVVDGGAPVPPPDPVDPPNPPDPVDPPAPQPNGKAASFVIVEDTSKAGPWRGQMFGSPRLHEFLNANKVKWKLYDFAARDRYAVGGKAKEFTDKAQGKELPYLFTFDADGKALASETLRKRNADGTLRPPTIDDLIAALSGPAHKRAMGNNPPNQRTYRWAQFGASPNVPLIPRAEWKETTLAAFLPPVKDQDGIGACNAYATTGAVESARAQQGLAFVELNADWLYGRINGGRDQGSMLEDGLAWACERGVIPLTNNHRRYDWRTNPAGWQEAARKYLVLEAYECPTFDAMASAIQQGFYVVHGLMWYDNYDTDAQGWLPERGRGGAGGHALFSYGVAKHLTTGRWGLLTQNSWNVSWGGSKDGKVPPGHCVIPEGNFGRGVGGFWAVRSVVVDGFELRTQPKTFNKLEAPGAVPEYAKGDSSDYNP